MYAEGITLNPNAYTGSNLGSTLSRLSGPTGDTQGNSQGILQSSDSTSTQPVIVEIKHSTVRKGKAKYQRSTIAFIREKLTPPTDNPEGVNADGYTSVVRIIVEKPVISGVISDIAVVNDWARLYSFFGTTLASAGVPSGAVLKFITREA